MFKKKRVETLKSDTSAFIPIKRKLLIYEKKKTRKVKTLTSKSGKHISADDSPLLGNSLRREDLMIKKYLKFIHRCLE